MNLKTKVLILLVARNPNSWVFNRCIICLLYTSGVNVTSSSGQPGASPKVRIRGTGTINNSDPRYIVDGMPIEGGLDYLNPSDIESIEVLKDAGNEGFLIIFNYVDKNNYCWLNLGGWNNTQRCV